MKLKTCGKCGWQYPGNWPGRRCKFCGTIILQGYCSRCGEWSDNLKNSGTTCTKCRTKADNAWRNRLAEEGKRTFDSWLEKVKQATNKPLTEEEWLQACQHFGGCAYCGKQQIAARCMFIRFADGGRYCAWNVVPACEECAVRDVQITNPFIRMNDSYNRNKNSNGMKNHGLTKDNLKTITDYLATKF